MSKVKSPRRSSIQTATTEAVHSQAAGTASTDVFHQTNTDDADRATSLIGMNELRQQTLVENAPAQLQVRLYASLDQKGVAAPGSLSTADAHVIAKGVKVLETLLVLTSNVSKAFVAWSSAWDDQTSLGPIEKAAWQATHAMIADLRQADSSKEVYERSRILTERSASHVFYPPSAEDRALCRAFSGDLLRWELVGMYCTRIGLYFGYQDATTTLGTGEDVQRQPKSMLRQAFFACTECASLCAALGQVNDLTLFHICTAISLATWCFGDDSYHAWQLIGDVSSVVYALKFHVSGVISENVPLYLSELRKRALGQIHEHDKQTATFVGRPPRLTRRYCVFHMPLDLANEILEGPTQALETAVAMLGEDGWNSHGLIVPATRQRVLMILCPLREEVLELSLGSSVADWVPHAQSILGRLELAWQSIPHASDQMPDWNRQPWLSSMLRLFARLEYLYTKFLLHKLLVRHDQAHRTSFLWVAQEILSSVLSTFKQRVMVLAHRLDMEWTMVFYAMPCASVLLWELINRPQAPVGSTVPNRATVIRDITSLITCCDWLVASGESNYDICTQAQAVFSKGLDIVLNTADPPPMVPDVLPAIGQDTSFEQLTAFRPEASDAFVQDPQWTAWLETLGLQSDSWMDIDGVIDSLPEQVAQ